MRKFVYLLLMSVGMTTAFAEVKVIRTVAPSGYETREGDSVLSYNDTYLRFQQLIDASVFKDVIPEGGWITVMALRGDGPSSVGAGSLITGAQISFSTTARGVDQLSPVFDENIGSDRQVFFSRTLYMELGGKDANGIRIFAPFIFADRISGTELDGFFYDPRKGNLLIDFRNLRPEQLLSGWFLDAVTSPVMSSVYVDPPSEDDSKGTVSRKGLVLQFTVIAVPEPSGLAMFATGAALGAQCC